MRSRISKTRSEPSSFETAGSTVLRVLGRANTGACTPPGALLQGDWGESGALRIEAPHSPQNLAPASIDDEQVAHLDMVRVAV